MHIVPTVLPAATITRIALQVAKLSDPPSPSTLKVLESYANVAKVFLETNIDATCLKPVLDAISAKIGSFGASRAKWAVEFVGAVALYSQASGKSTQGTTVRMPRPERARRAGTS